MAAFSSLPDELLFMIGAHLDHPPDVLHFCQSCKYIGRVITPLLYEHITLDCQRYCDRAPKHGRGPNDAQPFMTMIHLVRRVEDDVGLRPIIRYLTLRLESCTSMENYGLFRLLRLLPSLNSLDIDVRLPGTQYRETRYFMGFPIVSTNIAALKPASIAVALTPFGNRIKSLSLFADFELLQHDTPAFGTLKYFTALEHLDIQAAILLGRKTAIPHSDWTSCLADRLPLRLKQLQIRCYRTKDGGLGQTSNLNAADVGSIIVVGTQLSFLLEQFLRKESQPQTMLRKITVWLSPCPEWMDNRAKACRQHLVSCKKAVANRSISLRIQLLCNGVINCSRLCPSRLNMIRSRQR